MVGKQLGDYLIQEKLATGGMSYVFLGEDVTLGRRAAVKVLTPDITEDDDSLPDRFKREARAVAQLEHNHIIPIYQFGELEGVYFLAMRFIEGHDFADEINDARREGKLLDIKRALDVLMQVASALDYAHANGIIHRDIKPSNILIDNNSSKAILTDFGLVLWSNVDKTLGTAFGTPRYISPEQATDSQAAVAQSDIYSLAVIFYEIVTGKMLFTGQSPMEMAISHITEKPVPPRTHNPKIPIQVEREILRALDKEPNNRHKSATEFINALRQAYRQAGTIGKTDPNRSSVNDERVRKALESTKPAESTSDTWDKTSTEQQTSSDSDSLVQSARPGSTVKLDESDGNSRIFVFGGLIVAVLILGVFSVLLAGGAGSSALPTIAVTNTAEGGAVAVVDVTDEPSPTDEPTLAPTDAPTDEPTDEPTATDEPTDVPTDEPTDTPTDQPTDEPTITPTITVTPSPTPTPTDEPPATDYPILQELPEGVPMQLIYDMTLIAIRNNSEGAVVLSDMRLSGENDDGVGEFDGSTLPSVALLPGECVVIRSETIPVPIEWECARERSNVLLQTPARFWFADSNDDTTYRVFWRSNAIKSCDTVGRAVGNVDTTICDLEWPVVADG
jgi:serine/threonine protein kinase